MKTKKVVSQKSVVKILVVDDREDNLFSIETILEQDGYEIRRANSGRSALKILLNEHDFTLILMDVQMPDMNGFETASLIYQRDKLKHIPIIFITAHNHDEDFMFKGYKMGAVDFIYKPINPDLLRFKVSVFADLYQKTHQLMAHEKVLKSVNSDLENEIEERRISEEKIMLLNQQLLTNNSELKMINEELDRFAYVASHDLQEPLRKILIFSDVVSSKLDGQVDKEIHQAFSKITRASARMQKLIDDLLKFSRHSNTNEEFKLINLNDVLQEVISDIDYELKKKNGKINYSDLPSLRGIPSQLHQLFQNLITNSLKFCKPDCPPEITIYHESFKPRQLNNNSTASEAVFHRIFIKDNGIGFDSKYADEIFVVFKRLHSYHEFEGTGIGLSICKKIVEKHNGYISAESKPNEGATFIITLPESRNSSYAQTSNTVEIAGTN